jgi:uncharacterized RDD family membrane protein YckC
MIYDGLLITALLMVAAAVAVIPLGSEVGAGTIWFQLYLLIVWWAYFAICWHFGGQTVGMRAWRLVLVTERGSYIGPAAAGLRFIVAILSTAAIGLGFLWSLFEAERRTWHDIASATRLVVIPKQRERP